MPNASAQKGSTIAEYAILLTLVAGVSIYGLQTLGSAMSGNLKKVDNVGTMGLLAPLGKAGGASSAAEGGGQPGSNTSTPVAPPSVLTDSPIAIGINEGQPTTVVAGAQGNRRGVNPPAQATPDSSLPSNTNASPGNTAPPVATADFREPKIADDSDFGQGFGQESGQGGSFADPPPGEQPPQG